MTQGQAESLYPPEGELILIDKDLDWTSFNVVKKVQILICKKYGIRKLKVGHAGTLDPLATGLVIICTGRQTKQISTYQEKEKEYIAEIRLGASTPSFDLETEIDKKFNTSDITEQRLKEALESFLGEQEQLPPAFSAKFVNGKRAYEYARKGKEVELKTSKVHFYSLEMIHFELPVVKVLVRCSKGTYIRSLARDLGEKLNNGAHLTALRRTAIGEYKVENAMKISEFENKIQSLDINKLS